MIEHVCLCCGGSVIKPDPVVRTPMERIQFEKDWDAEYERRNPRVDSQGLRREHSLGKKS